MFNLTIKDYIEKLASLEPTPGGGAAAALTAAQAAALLSMTLNVTFKKNLTEAACEHLADLRDAQERFLALATADAAAFTKVMAAYGLAKNSAAEKTARSTALEEALAGATEVPMQLLREIASLTNKAAFAIEHGSKQIISDAAIALVLLRAAARASKYNIDVNLALLKKPDFKNEVKQECKKLLAHIKVETKALRRIVAAKLA